MEKTSYPIQASAHQIEDDPEQMIRLCKAGWLLVNTLVGREILDGGAFADTIYYVLVKPA